jgi:hypothetical protein
VIVDFLLDDFIVDAGGSETVDVIAICLVENWRTALVVADLVASLVGMSKVAAVVNKVVITVGDVLVYSVPECVAVFDDCLTELLFVDVNGSFVTVEFEEIDIILFFVEYVAEPVDGCFMTLVVLTVDVL